MEDLIQSLIESIQNVDFVELSMRVWDAIVGAWENVRDFFEFIVEWWTENGTAVQEIIRTVRTLYRNLEEVVPHIYQQFQSISGQTRYRVVKSETVIPVEKIPQFGELKPNVENVLTEAQCNEIELMVGR